MSGNGSVASAEMFLRNVAAANGQPPLEVNRRHPRRPDRRIG